MSESKNFRKRGVVDKMRKTLLTLLALALLIPLEASGTPAVKKLLIYYGYPSLFNGSRSVYEAAPLFDKYDFVVLADGLEEQSHPEHEAARTLLSLSKAVFYGYIDTMQPIGDICRKAEKWKALGVKGVLLDDFGFDYLVPFLGSREDARRHQAKALECVRAFGLEVAINAWNPDDLSGEVSGVSLNLTGVPLLVEHAIYGFGNKTEEFVDHFYRMLLFAEKNNAKLWCLTSTAAKSSYENKAIGYDALTYLYPECDAYAIQEDYGEDSRVFYAFSNQSAVIEYLYGVNVVLWGSLDETWYRSTLERLAGDGFDSLLVTFFLSSPSVDSEYVVPFEYTPSDADLRKAVALAREMGFKVYLRVNLIVTGGWAGELKPRNLETWFKNYTGYLQRYASLAQNLGVDGFVFGTEMSQLDKLEDWRGVVSALRKIYTGRLGYAANWDSEATSFWDLLDFIGIDAYYPILNLSSWHLNHEKRIEPLQLIYGKPIIFTEIGYRSARGAASEPWNWQSRLEKDYSEQYRLYTLFLSCEAPRINGFFYWGEAPWADDGTGYSVLGKPAEEAFRAWLKVYVNINLPVGRSGCSCNPPGVEKPPFPAKVPYLYHPTPLAF